MAGSSVVAVELFRLLPWMRDPAAPSPRPAAEGVRATGSSTVPLAAHVEDPGVPLLEHGHGAGQVAEEGEGELPPSPGHLVWLRVWGGDLSELAFWSTSLSGLGFIIGCIVSWLLNPNANTGGLLTPLFLFCFILVGSVGMVVWGPRYLRDGFALTFEGHLVVGALLGTFPSLAVMAPVSVVSAFVAPAVMHAALSTRLFQRYHPAVAVQSLGALMVLAGFVILSALGL